MKIIQIRKGKRISNKVIAALSISSTGLSFRNPGEKPTACDITIGTKFTPDAVYTYCVEIESLEEALQISQHLQEFIFRSE